MNDINKVDWRKQIEVHKVRSGYSTLMMEHILFHDKFSETYLLLFDNAYFWRKKADFQISKQ